MNAKSANNYSLPIKGLVQREKRQWKDGDKNYHRKNKAFKANS